MAVEKPFTSSPFMLFDDYKSFLFPWASKQYSVFACVLTFKSTIGRLYVLLTSKDFIYPFSMLLHENKFLHTFGLQIYYCTKWNEDIKKIEKMESEKNGVNYIHAMFCVIIVVIIMIVITHVISVECT